MKAIETQKKFLEAIGLKIGDKVKVNFYNAKLVFEIVKDGKSILLCKEKNGTYASIGTLFAFDWEKIEIKRVGDTRCYEHNCFECPLKDLYSCNNIGRTKDTKLFDMLESRKTILNPKLYNTYMEILNEEVKEK